MSVRLLSWCVREILKKKCQSEHTYLHFINYDIYSYYYTEKRVNGQQLRHQSLLSFFLNLNLEMGSTKEGERTRGQSFKFTKTVIFHNFFF